MTPPNRRYKVVKVTQREMTPEEKEKERIEAALNTSIAETQLAVRVINTFEANGIILVRDLFKETYESLMAMNNFGDKTLKEVKKAIAHLGLEAPDWTKPKAVRSKKHN